MGIGDYLSFPQRKLAPEQWVLSANHKTSFLFFRADPLPRRARSVRASGERLGQLAEWIRLAEAKEVSAQLAPKLGRRAAPDALRRQGANRGGICHRRTDGICGSSAEGATGAGGERLNDKAPPGEGRGLLRLQGACHRVIQEPAWVAPGLPSPAPPSRAEERERG